MITLLQAEYSTYGDFQLNKMKINLQNTLCQCIQLTQGIHHSNKQSNIALIHNQYHIFTVLASELIDIQSRKLIGSNR